MILTMKNNMDESDTMFHTVPSTGYTFDFNFSADFDLSLLPSPEQTIHDVDCSTYMFDSPSSLGSYNPKPDSFDKITFDKPQDELFQEISSLYTPHSSPQHTSLYSPAVIDFKDLKDFKEETFDDVNFSNQFSISSPSSCSSSNYSNNSSPLYVPPVSPESSALTESLFDLNESIEEFKRLQRSLEESINQKVANKNEKTLVDLLRDNSGGNQKFDASALSKSPMISPKNRNQFIVKQEKECESFKFLKAALKDTTFQKKFNIKPFNVDFVDVKMEVKEEPQQTSLFDQQIAREKIEPVLSLAIEQMKKDVDNVCSVLGISSDPSQWSNEDVKAWLLWTLRQFNLTPVQMEFFDMNGRALAELTEEDFNQRSIESGSILHAQLEIWKAAYMESKFSPSQDNLIIPTTIGQITQSTVSSNWFKTNDCTTNNNTPESYSEDVSETEETTEPASLKMPSKSTPRTSTSATHIHLWQFLKELLASPALYGSAIRWVDRENGVFKIEDSVRVARLWGKRKNRPAMNYDKLSRSIRQYYKKGIMKKTERSQRLVYQFCHPYCL